MLQDCHLNGQKTYVGTCNVAHCALGAGYLEMVLSLSSDYGDRISRVTPSNDLTSHTVSGPNLSRPLQLRLSLSGPRWGVVHRRVRVCTYNERCMYHVCVRVC